MRPLRVLHVDSASEYRGGQNQARLLIGALGEAADVQQGLLAAQGSRLIEEVARLGIETHPVGWRSVLDPRPFLRLGRELRSGWDLVHAHDSHGLQTAVAARALAGRRVRLVASRRVSVPMRSPITWKQADGIIAVSESVRTTLLTQGIEASRIRVIPSGISLDELALAVPGRLREICGIGNGVPFVGVVGALTAEKGHAWFIESAARVAATMPDVHFAIFGEGPERDRLRKLVAGLSMEHRITMPGHVDHIGPSLGDIDLFVMPSLSEGLGTAALEAMLVGRPVVVSRAGGLVDLAGSSIPTVSPGDVAGLASEMERLLADEAARRALARRARERAALFTTERTSHSTLQYYRDLLAAG